MAELRHAPTDIIGVPRALIPSERLAIIPASSEESTGHHEFYLPGIARFHDLGSQALRSARILKAESAVHNTGPESFHQFYDISAGPHDKQNQSNILLLTLAGYIPKEGIDLWSGEPIIREFDEWEREILCEIDHNRELTFTGLRTERDVAANFIKKFVLEQSPVSIDPDILERFVSNPKIGLTRDEGHEVLRSNIHAAVEPVNAYYSQVRNEGLLHPMAPFSAEELVLRILGNEAGSERLLHPLRQRLAFRQVAAA